ncbi:MAG TPA: HD domain-containing protein [Thermomicrobiales bacterium]|jgi:putative nucleotidyltransferase with HDIG domain|nr:HD domain-containing protein [Thermomicrobiales bacterium]
MEITRENAWALLTEFVKGEPLLKHCLGVEASMREYARVFGEDEELWGFIGLIHDFDFEIHPTLDQHPQDGAPILRERGVPEPVIQSILSHADHLDVPRSTRLELTLAAVDEMSGFVTAVALVRPTKSIDEVTPASVKKKMKDKAFARAVNRDEMRHNAEALGIDFDEHIQHVIDGVATIAPRLGLSRTVEAVEAGN